MDFYSNGKLLVTGEYLVLDGAKALALPTKKGQSLSVEVLQTNQGFLFWKSLDVNNSLWFECTFDKNSLSIIKTSNIETALVLRKILLTINKSNSHYLSFLEDILVITKLDFDRNWGLGSSSTLINNMASWAKVNAFNLQFKIFGGSAYDVACAQNDSPIIYQLNKDKPNIESVNFNPEFKENLFFVYLNKKQNSRDAIKTYYQKNKDKSKAIKDVSLITNQLIISKTLNEFEFLLKKHEDIISKIIGIAPIQKKLFNDYFGQIKSLGAWGGDFILATGNNDTIQYFKEKGFEVVIPFDKMIL